MAYFTRTAIHQGRAFRCNLSYDYSLLSAAVADFNEHGMPKVGETIEVSPEGQFRVEVAALCGGGRVQFELTELADELTARPDAERE